MKKKPNILVCPLDWGIGHATRCIPIINELIQQDVNVIIGADNLPYALLENEFPQLHLVRFPGYTFTYPGNDKMALKMVKQVPMLLSGIRSENHFLNRIIQDLNIDAVISDNRFGLYNNNIPCVFLTHQVSIKVPSFLKIMEPILYKLNAHYISKYDECWIPDWENDFTLSGDLSHKRPKLANTFFIGPLSRFRKQIEKNGKQNYKYDFAVIISGPEPQRSIFEKSVLEQLSGINQLGVVILGKPGFKDGENKIKNGIDVFSHLSSKALESLIINSKTIICRPGYSSIMDLVALGKQAVFIPTPGQTEQEYLADYFFNDGLFLRMFQDDFDIDSALKQVKNFKGLQKEFDNGILKERINSLLNKLRRF